MDSHCHTTTLDSSSCVSVIQRWLLHLVRLKPLAPIHTTIVLELSGQLSRRSLRSALDQLVFRHEILRTVFRQIDHTEVALVGPAEKGVFLLDQDAETEQDALCMLQEETRAPFDVSHGPMIRTRLLQVATNRSFLLISAHPLVCDNASIRSILREIRDLYGVFSQDGTDLPCPAPQYADYARRD
jgi:hypothetical protein